jgi:hypothetical protein
METMETRGEIRSWYRKSGISYTIHHAPRRTAVFVQQSSGKKVWFGLFVCVWQAILLGSFPLNNGKQNKI